MSVCESNVSKGRERRETERTDIFKRVRRKYEKRGAKIDKEHEETKEARQEERGKTKS